MFMGETLRGLLLYGYAFATMGTIAGIGAIAAFVGAASCSCWRASASGTRAGPATDVTAEAQPVGAHV